jgi:Fur family ferric uptake transcriptional regulator
LQQAGEMAESTKPTEITITEAREMLRNANLRSTSSRLAVLQHLSTSSLPLSHADVADALVPEGFDKSTLYRCLVELADAGLLARLDAGDHAWRFELKRGDDHSAAQHPHFVCLDCGKVTCLPEVDVKIVAAKKAAAAVGDITEIFLKGHCPQCR